MPDSKKPPIPKTTSQPATSAKTNNNSKPSKKIKHSDNHSSEKEIFQPVLDGWRKPDYFKLKVCKDILQSRLRTGRYQAKEIAKEAEISINTFHKYDGMMKHENDLILLTKEQMVHLAKTKSTDEMNNIRSKIKAQNIGWKEPPVQEKKPVPKSFSESLKNFNESQSQPQQEGETKDSISQNEDQSYDSKESKDPVSDLQNADDGGNKNA
jgi:hypothetical protein